MDEVFRFKILPSRFTFIVHQGVTITRSTLIIIISIYKTKINNRQSSVSRAFMLFKFKSDTQAFLNGVFM